MHSVSQRSLLFLPRVTPLHLPRARSFSSQHSSPASHTPHTRHILYTTSRAHRCPPPTSATLRAADPAATNENVEAAANPTARPQAPSAAVAATRASNTHLTSSKAAGAKGTALQTRRESSCGLRHGRHRRRRGRARALRGTADIRAIPNGTALRHVKGGADGRARLMVAAGVGRRPARL